MVENTSNRPPETHLIGAMLRGTSYITDMEAAGAREMVAADVLPVQGLHHPDPDGELERLGVGLGAVVIGDELFRQVTLPDGWSRRLTDHDMWSEIVDDHGEVRLLVFYKAAFYDRAAHFQFAQPRGGE